MAQGKQQLKFEIWKKSVNRFRDNRYRTDGSRTPNEFRFYELCWYSQAELKKMSKFQNFKFYNSLYKIIMYYYFMSFYVLLLIQDASHTLGYYN